MIWSDISVENAVIIVICYDNRPSHVVGQDLGIIRLQEDVIERQCFLGYAHRVPWRLGRAKN